MKLLFILFVAPVLFAQSQSFLATARQANASFGPTLVNSIRQEVHAVLGNGPDLTNSTLWRLESDFGIDISYGAGNVDTLTCLGRGGANGGSVSIAGMTNVRIVCRRDAATGRYTAEVWDEVTGVYRSSSAVDASPGSYTTPGGSLWIGGQYAAPAIVGSISFVRVYSSAGPLGVPPQRLRTSGFGDLADYEFEGNLNDSSGHGRTLSMSTGTVSYGVTPILPPFPSLGSIPTTIRAGRTQALTAQALVNEDNNTATSMWALASGPSIIAISNPESLTSASFLPLLAGQYEVSLSLVTTTNQRASAVRKIGVVTTDTNGVVVVPETRIDKLLGPLIRFGANLWNWFDHRNEVLASNQISMQSTFWGNPWDTPNGLGTITVSNGNNVVTGSGTQFQTQFCGGAGNTVPTSPTDYVTIYYDSADYPGTTGRAFYPVKSCTSQTSMRLGFVGGGDRAWGHASGTQTGRSYWVPSNTNWQWWTSSGTPGNYYDNVLALYALYYRTGLTSYRDAARTLARNFWYGPFYDRGKNYDTTNLGGNFIAAGPARGQSITGLILWAIESGENIWPGMDYVLRWHRDVGHVYAASRSWAVQIGDVREQAYITAAYALCSTYHPNATWRNDCRGWLRDYVNLFWSPLQITATKEWRNTAVARAGYFGVSTYATVVNGSTSITLTGATWDDATFSSGFYLEPNKLQRLWFFSNYTNIDLPGKQNSDIGGDAVFYTVATVTSPTTAVLTQPYAGTSGNKGLIVSHFAGFGTQPFMLGLAGGVFGTYAYDALVGSGDTAEAAKVRQFSIDAANWLSSTGLDQANHVLYSGRGFVNCEPNGGGDNACASGPALNGEAMRAFSAAYLLTGSGTIRSAADEIYTRLWCKPTGGWTCGTTGFGTYLNDIDDEPGSGGYMINPGDPLTNKWLGFFFGYGFGPGWPAARNNGLGSSQPVAIQFSLGPAAGETAAPHVVYKSSAGSETDVTCVAATVGWLCPGTGEKRDAPEIGFQVFRFFGATTVQGEFGSLRIE